MARDGTFTVPHADDDSTLSPCGPPAMVTFEGHNPARRPKRPYRGALCRAHGRQFMHMAVDQVVTLTHLGETGDDVGSQSRALPQPTDAMVSWQAA